MSLEGHSCWEDCDEGPHGCICGNDCQSAPPVPARCRTCGWLLSDIMAHIDAMYDDHSGRAEPAQAWRDKQGDVWTLGDDGLMHTRETAPFAREHVEKKWGPLAPELNGERTPEMTECPYRKTDTKGGE